MSSMSGYITYIQYSASTEKGQTHAGDVFNTPFALSKVDPNYTGATVVETVAEAGKVKWGDAGSIGAVGKIAATDPKAEFHEGYVKKAGVELLVKLADVQVDDEVSYIYNNMVVPQNDLPRIKAEMKSIPLVAKARRVAIYYSQIAA